MKLLLADQLSLQRAGRELLKGVSLQLVAGELQVLLGPNGAGKSSLLRALAGEWPIAGGRIELHGEPLPRLTALQQARWRAVLPQQDTLAFGFTVLQLVTLGRHAAHQRGAAHEKRLIEEVLALTDTSHLAARLYPTLSGGEQRRAQLARVLAQVWDAENPVLLLDEPTHSLDLAHQHAVMTMLRAASGRGFAVLASLHDINLAAAYAQRISLLKAGRLIASGAPGEVLDNRALQNLYGSSLAFTPVTQGDTRQWLMRGTLSS